MPPFDIPNMKEGRQSTDNEFHTVYVHSETLSVNLPPLERPQVDVLEHADLFNASSFVLLADVLVIAREGKE